MGNRYERMQEKMQNFLTEWNYFDFLLASLCSMFEWEGLPVEQRHLEEYLHMFGSFAVQRSDKVPEGFLFAPDPGRGDTLDQFGEGLVVHGATWGEAFTIEGKINEDVIVCYNNTTHTPDFDMMLYSRYLSTVDRAIMTSTKLSVFAPVFCTPDSKSQKEMEDIIDRLLEGEIKVFKDVEKEPLLQDQAQPLYSIDAVDPKRIETVQYHSQLWMDMLRRFFAKYGIDIQSTNKRAQVSNDEANALDAYSWIMPLNMLKEREAFCERINTVFGTSWSVRFSELWMQEYDQYSRITEGGENDAEASDDGEDSDAVDGNDTSDES